MPSFLNCSNCSAKFAFSPALLGRTVRCRGCGYTFVVPASTDAPPPSPPPAPEAKPTPPPLPPQPSAARPTLRDSERAPRRSASPPREPVRQGGAAMLILLIVAFGGGFLLIGGGIAYLLWPTSSPPVPAVHAEPAPVAAAGPAIAGPAPVPPPVFQAPPRPADLAPPPVRFDPPVLDPPALVPPKPDRPPPPALPDKTAPRWHPVSAFPITPATLAKERSEIRLPGSISDVCVGGGGRFLLISLPREKQVAVFDATQARVVKYLAIAGDTPRIAAGMDRLFVADRSTGVLQRFNLRTFEKEVTVPLRALSGRSQVDALVTGSATAGPVLVGVTEREQSGGTALFLDPVTLKEVTPNFGANGRFPGFTPYLARASADGRTFVIHDGHGGEPHALKVISFLGTTAKISGEVWPAPASIGVPNADGSLIYTARGVYTPDLKGVGADQQVNALPARHGAFAIRLQPAGEPHQMKVRGKSPAASTLTFHLARDDRALARLENVEGIHHEGIAYGSSQDRINHDKRVHWIPDARLLVTIPQTNDRLCLYRFDLEAAMATSDIDFLYVASTPPAVAVKGLTYVYPMSVKSKKGGIRVKLESGPAGMKIGSDLKLTWAVPATFDQADVDVLLTVSDATGQEIFHTFRVAIRAPGEVPE